jgi:hypothetical protein
VPKYDPLKRLLRRQKTNEVLLSFREIENALGNFLPKSAERPQWWSNEVDPMGRHVQCRAWLDVGFEAYLLKSADKVAVTGRLRKARVNRPQNRQQISICAEMGEKQWSGVRA